MKRSTGFCKSLVRRICAVFLVITMLFNIRAEVSLVTVAWFKSGFTEPSDLSANIRAKYFESGDGMEESPYEIATPIQLYFFAWLQNLGYFNVDRNNDGKIEPVYFILSDKYGDAINMEGYTLPPAGTEHYPFLGNFNGNDVTIENLNVSTTLNDYNKKPSVYADANVHNAQIVGFFGVVGEYNGQAITDSTANAISGLKLDNVTIKSISPEANKTLVGIVAGYVNATISNTTVSNSNIELGTGLRAIDEEGITNISDYSVVGYCKPEYLDDLSIEEISANAPDVEFNDTNVDFGDGDAWGGSIDMKSMYNRLCGVFDKANAPRYPTKETVYIDINGTQTITTTETASSGDYIIYKDDYSSYTFNRYNKNDNSKTFLYLYGAKTIDSTSDSNTSNSTKKLQKTVNTTREKSKAGYYITNGSNYLTANGSTVSNTTSSENATVWVMEESGSTTIYTYVNNTKYYLYINGSNLQISTSQTTWNRAGNQISSGNKKLYYDEALSKWTLKTVTVSYKIHYNGNYLCLNNSGQLNNGTNENEATQWVFSNGINGGTISTTFGGSTYYLNLSNNALAVGTTNNTSWSVSDGKIYNGNYFIEFENEWKAVYHDMYYLISDGNGYYLNYNNNSTPAVGTSYDEATRWSRDNNGNYYVNSNLYLGCTTSLGSISNGVYIGSNPDYKYKLDNDGYLMVSFNAWMSTKTYCIKFNNSSWTAVTKSNNATKITVETIVPTIDFSLSLSEITDDMYNLTFNDGVTIYTETTTSTETSSFDTIPTYYPLSFETDNVTPKSSNTGYVISDGNFIRDGTTFRGGDIRVSQYSISGNINSSYDSNTKRFTSVYTIDGSGDHTIPTNHTYNKYDDSKTELLNVLNGQSNVYGLHFMNASISMDKKITIPNAFINGDEYTNYELPTDALDFNLKKKGYVNFFAGTYFSGNKSFFSLHKIYRNDNEITDIKEISKVYGTNHFSDKYIYEFSDNSYEYSDGTPVSSPPTGYEMKFDTRWIKTQSSLTSKRVYYFEIPMDQGEYALGSVDGGTGAYLLYLDISANAQEVKTTTTSELITTTEHTYSYPKGIQLVGGGGSYSDASDSVTVALASGSSGIYNYTRNGNNVTLSGTGSPTANYIAENINLTHGANKLTMNGNITQQSIMKRVIIDELNISEKKHTITTFKQTDGGAVSNSYIIYNINDDLENTGTPTQGARTPTELAEMEFVFDEHNALTDMGTFTYRYVKNNTTVTNELEYTCKASYPIGATASDAFTVENRMYTATVTPSNAITIYIRDVLANTIHILKDGMNHTETTVGIANNIVNVG